MFGLETYTIQCPHCWETFEIVIDCSVMDQSYIEDCYVCCRPISLQIHIDHAEEISVTAQRTE